MTAYLPSAHMSVAFTTISFNTISFDTIPGHTNSLAPTQRPASGARLHLGVRGESGEQIHQLLGLAGLYDRNQALSQWLRRDVSGIEELEARGRDLHRPHAPVSRNGLARGQPFAFPVIYDPHDPLLFRARCLPQIPLLGGPGVNKY